MVGATLPHPKSLRKVKRYNYKANPSYSRFNQKSVHYKVFAAFSIFLLIISQLKICSLMVMMGRYSFYDRFDFQYGGFVVSSFPFII